MGPAVTAAPSRSPSPARPAACSPRPVGARGAAAEPVELELDAVEFCRSLAGRADAEGLLTTIVPF
ncbi:MAG: hypothetical protein M5T61_17320 [Acidimicrobiia bacterium]|nr:hypothetical protein [Acidimicrobiia bacterium]